MAIAWLGALVTGVTNVHSTDWSSEVAEGKELPMPNSLLWVCLVAIWLFVLVPMVVKSRPTVRKTSDAALATRVLHRGGRTIAKTKRRMASGRHPHDAEWEPPVREYRKVVAKSGGTATAVKDPDVDVVEVDQEVGVVDTEAPEVEKTPVMKKVAVEADSKAVPVDAEAEDEVEAEADTEVSVDAEVVDEADDVETAEDDAVAEVEDDSEAEGDEDTEEAELDDSELDEADLEDAEYGEDDDYEDAAEYDDDHVVEDEDTAGEVAEDNSARRTHRGGFDPEADRERSDKRYRFRQRVMALLGGLALVSMFAGVMVGTAGWVAAGLLVAALIGYMSFLRRAVRNEQRIYQQRMRRLARARREEEARRAHPEVDPRADIPARLRRPGAIVLEIDDEDPIFDHLPRYVPASRLADMDRHDSYRRVVGQ